MKIKNGRMLVATFIHSDPGNAKADKSQENEVKTRRNTGGTWTKKGGKSHFGHKSYNIITRNMSL